MRAQPVDLIGGYYADDTLPWSCQDTVNWLPVMAEVAGTRTPKYLKTPPGLKPYKQVGAGPIRGMHDCEGGRFVVSGQTLCRINPNGTIDPLGTIPGVGRVTMTHNQFKTGNQLLVENGQGGGGYVYDTSAGTFAKITDEGYPGSISSDYLDSYLLGVEPQGRFWFHSNLADATDYNTLDRYESEASPDRIVGLAVSQFEVVVFNQTTIEFFYNAGSGTGTFQNRRQTVTRGCASRYSIAKLDNTLFWLGDDGIVYRMDGYSAIPVSTGPMARAFVGKNWAEAFAFIWEDQGFKIYYLTFPDGHTWGYDVVSRLWTRRESFGLDRWRLSEMIKWGASWYGGDFQAGRIWQIDWDYLLEGDQEFISRRISPVLADNQSLLGIPSAELIFDAGQGPMTTVQPFPIALTLTGSPPSTLVGLGYPDFSFVAGGGTGPYVFSISKGALPAGLSLSSSGAITGSSVAGGTFNFTVRVFDSRQLWTEADFSIVSLSNTPGLAIPRMFFRGSHEALSPVVRITEITASRPSQFSISPSAAFAYIGLATAPYGVLYRANSALNSYAPYAGIDSTLTSEVRAVSFSRNGLYLAIAHGVYPNMVVEIYKLEGGSFVKKSSITHEEVLGRISWSWDDSMISIPSALGAPYYGVRVVKFDKDTDQITGSITASANMAAQDPRGLSWSYDNKFLAYWSSAGVRVCAVGEQSISAAGASGGGSPSSSSGAFFSRDGSFLYTSSSPSEIKLAAYPFEDGALGAPVVVAPPFPVDDSDFSNGYLAIGTYGGTSTGNSVLIYKADGLTLAPILTQPAYASDEKVGAIRWTS